MAVGNFPVIPNTYSRMALSVREVKERAREGRNSSVKTRAAVHQNRLKFHCETRLTRCTTQPVSDFLAFAQNLLTHEKFKTFNELFRMPCATIELTSVCFDKLSRIFDGRNPAFNYQFLNTEQKDDWEWYRKEVLHEPNVWQTTGWQHFKTEINSVLVVDMPEKQDDDDRYPQPYFYWLPIERVIAFDADKQTGVMRYIIFREGDDKVVAIDDESYRIFSAKNGMPENLVSEHRHDIGYCPARFFWNEAISLKDPFVKASPITKVLAQLDWYLFYHISKQHLDLYGSYPIYSGYEQRCDFSNEENGDYCDGGFLKNKQGYYLLDNAGELVACPKCGKKRIIGAGSFVEVPVPVGDQPDLKNPVQMLSVDRSALDYNVSEHDRLRDEIITTVVGQNEEITQREAFNEQQVRAAFKSQSTILNRVKKGFEEAQEFVDSTICRLRYGENFVSAKINYGTEFFILSPSELREKYKAAKEAGMSEGELDALHTQIIEAEYRNDPTQMSRMMTLADIEPYRHLTRSEVMDLYDKGLVGEDDLKVKLNFSSLIKRFERENANILEFGTAIPYSQKINLITETLKDYVSE